MVSRCKWGGKRNIISGWFIVVVCYLKDLSYGLGVDIADGYWHHIAVAWENADPAEINLYVDGQFQDQQVFGQGENLGTK